MTQPVSVAVQIATHLLSLGKGNVSRHLDELIDEIPVADNYGEWSLSVFAQLVDYLRAAGERRLIACVIPLSITNKLQTQTLKLHSCIKEFAPLTVYLLAGPELFATADEEYRKIISASVASNAFDAVFRCWRTPDAAVSSWEEFNNDIYLFSRSLDEQISCVN